MALPQRAMPVPAIAPAGTVSTNGENGWYWRLKENLSAASQARDLAWEALARLGLEVELIDDAVAVVGELVANAVIHGLPPIELQLLASGRHVRLLVVDHAQGLPVWGCERLESLSGRGLRVVSSYSGGNCGTAAAAFRSAPGLHGKTVWAVLPRRPGRLQDLEPVAMARLLQRWLARRGMRHAAFRSNGGVPLVSVPSACTIWCLPGRVVIETEDAHRGCDYQVFTSQELPDVVGHLVEAAKINLPC